MGRGGAWLWHRHGCLFAYCGSLLWWMLAFARDLLLIVNTADMMCGPDGVPVSFVERLADVEARYGVGSRQAVDVGVMLGVLRRELELRGVSVADAERAGVERVDMESEFPESAAGAEGVSAADVDAADAVDSL